MGAGGGVGVLVGMGVGVGVGVGASVGVAVGVGVSVGTGVSVGASAVWVACISATACVAVVLCLAFATPRAGGAFVVGDLTGSARRLEVRETVPRAVAGAVALSPLAESPTPTPAPPTGCMRDHGSAPCPEPIPTAPRVATG